MQKAGIKKTIIVLAACIIFLPCLSFADSFTFTTEIDGVSNYSGFGMNLFPVGTTFAYYNYFPLFSKEKQAEIYLQSNMAFSDSWIDGNYDMKTSEPRWINQSVDQGEMFFRGNRYFNPRGYIELWLQQGMLTNPVSGGTLLYLRAGANSNYSMAVESQKAQSGEEGFAFVDSSGNLIDPYKPKSTIPAFPWLEGNRRTLNNYVFLRSYWYLNRNIAYDFNEGIYGELFLEYGPKWLFNTYFPAGTVQSDFYRIYGYFEQKLSLLNKKQADGKDLVYIYLGHYNSMQYVGGSVVPSNKIPGDRLRGSFSDRIWMRFAGPQFISGDCYSYIELRLNNNFYFGHVVNEVSNNTKAFEYQSSVSATLHLRLFGFIRFQYEFGCDLARGIWPWNPGWWQNASLQFYVSI